MVLNGKRLRDYPGRGSVRKLCISSLRPHLLRESYKKSLFLKNMKRFLKKILCVASDAVTDNTCGYGIRLPEYEVKFKSNRVILPPNALPNRVIRRNDKRIKQQIIQF